MHGLVASLVLSGAVHLNAHLVVFAERLSEAGDSAAIYMKAGDRAAALVPGIPTLKDHPQLIWDPSAGAVVCSSVALKRTWILRPRFDGSCGVEAAKRYFLPSRETVDGRYKASWDDSETSPASSWRLTLISNGRSRILTLADFAAASRPHKTDAIVLWSGWSPKRSSFAICFKSAWPPVPSSPEKDSIAYVINATTGKIRYLGHGYRCCWLSDSMISRTFENWEEGIKRPGDERTLNCSSTIVDLTGHRTQQSLHDMEILSSTTDPLVAYVLYWDRDLNDAFAFLALRDPSRPFDVTSMRGRAISGDFVDWRAPDYIAVAR